MKLWATGLGHYSQGPDANAFWFLPGPAVLETAAFQPGRKPRRLPAGQAPLFALRYIFLPAASNSS